MEAEKCFCGAWVKQGKHEQLFDVTWLDEVEKIHHKMHALAREIKAVHQEGHVKTAIEGLSEIGIELEKIETFLKKG